MTNNKIIIGILVGVALNVFVWYSIITFSADDERAVYFLDVGQGDSTFIQFEGGIQVLVDGGPSGKIIEQLERVMGPTDRYIDMVVMTHPQLDHFGGFIDVLKRYEVGIFLHNGATSSIGAYGELQKVLRERKVYALALDSKDRVVYASSMLTVLWPENARFAKDPNDQALVMKFENPEFSLLLTADIPAKVEKRLLLKDISADILKVPHHGSKYSSSKEFLGAVRPKLSVIEVGKNRYGHPTMETLSRLAAVGSKVFRTDDAGLIKVKFENGKLKVYAQ